jgi:hypothetical protein
MLAVMHLLTRGAFAVSFEWRRLVQIVLVAGGVAVAGDLLLPTHGLLGFIARLAAFVAIPALLFLTGFAHQRELSEVRSLIARVRRPAPSPAGDPASGVSGGPA